MCVNISLQLQRIIITGFLLILYNNVNYKYIYNNVYNKLIFLIKFYNYICDNNPLLIDYCSETLIEKSEDKIEQEKTIEKFEEKYLQKFNEFPNEYHFDESELQSECELRKKVKLDFEKDKLSKIYEQEEILLKINNITNGVTFSEDEQMIFNEKVKTDLLNFYSITNYDSDCDDDDDELSLNNLYLNLLTEECEVKKNLHNLKQSEITDEEVVKQARDLTIRKKLDTYINNYVLEPTPLGNIYMRYNSDKGSFEYFSNNTIPYRYLEPVGRKYVMTYWCKPLFISLEEELKKAEIKYNEDKKNGEQKNKQNIYNAVKSYNKETVPQTFKRPNSVLPPQIKANLANVNQQSDKMLLKENANRYTWEGRISNFCPLKKIDKKIVDKNLKMSYADFKKMKQNKK